MNHVRIVALLIIAVLGVNGCGAVVETIEGAARIANREHRGPVLPVDAPDAALTSDPVVEQASRSVVKVRGTAPMCQKVLEGSGVVVAPNQVISTAHTVAGSEIVTVEVDGQEWPANVVVFDSMTDISILDVPGMTAPHLELASGIVPTGTDAVTLGYTNGGPLTVNSARIRKVVELNGPDLYRTTTVDREVYVIRGTVAQGDSGGPLIDMNGRVLGISFGAAVDDPETGFVLTTGQVAGHIPSPADHLEPVATGACVR